MDTLTYLTGHALAGALSANRVWEEEGWKASEIGKLAVDVAEEAAKELLNRSVERRANRAARDESRAAAAEQFGTQVGAKK